VCTCKRIFQTLAHKLRQQCNTNSSVLIFYLEANYAYIAVGTFSKSRKLHRHNTWCAYIRLAHIRHREFDPLIWRCAWTRHEPWHRSAWDCSWAPWHALHETVVELPDTALHETVVELPDNALHETVVELPDTSLYETVVELATAVRFDPKGH